MRIGPFGMWELLIILVIVLLLFGARRLPEMAKGMGQAIKEFRKGVKDVQGDLDSENTRPSQTTSQTTSQASEPSQTSQASNTPKDQA